MAPRHNLRISLALGLALVVAVPTVAAAGAPVAAKDLLPDLRMAKLYNLVIKTSPTGRKKLRFGTIVYNVGDGPLETRGRVRAGSEMTEVYQWIANDQGGGREVFNPAARMYYSGDGHNHWHTQGFIVMELYRKSAPSSVRRLKKIGFCLVDLRSYAKRLPNTAPTRVYPASGCGVKSWQAVGPPTRAKGMGISVGWGDDYQPQFAHQSIDITGLPKATYRLCATANANWIWAEKNNYHGNNYFWYDLSLNAAKSRFTILAKGRTPCRPT